LKSNKSQKDIKVQQRRVYDSQIRRKQHIKPKIWCGCFPIFASFVLSLLCASLFLFIPSRTNILIIGIDYTEPESSLGRSDTIIITTFKPYEPYIGILSIPRDLWVFIPNIGENRINTAHFFAEASQKGSGPQMLEETVESNFGIDINYYIRVKFDGFRELVNAMGGVDIELNKAMGGYPPGSYHLTGRKALAFVRHRQNSDDFFRMENGQFMIKQLLKQFLNPHHWPRLPAAYNSFSKYVETNIPFWIWPKMIFTLLQVGIEGIDSRSINREMVTPFITKQGASVLLPDWFRIKPVIQEMFDN
jgi:LCP family protein required for cell wall assembly